MIPHRVYHFRDPAGVSLGLGELRRKGLTLRGILFLALDPRGETYIAVAEDPESVSHIRVGDKLSLTPPWQGRYYHFDSVHRLPGDTVLWNGDRRLNDTGSASEVATALAAWLKQSTAKNVFLGCTAHQPGCWWTVDEQSPVVDLAELGFVDTVVTQTGLVARRIGEPTLFYFDHGDLANEGGPRRGWRPVYSSPRGNILMVERRAICDHLVLTCERGIVEVDISQLPKAVENVAAFDAPAGFGVLGRTDGGAFAVTWGDPKPWGLDDVSPAELTGDSSSTLREIVSAASRPA